MADSIKFNDEELKEITDLQNLYNTVVYQAGRFYLERLSLEEKENQVKSNFEEIRRQEQEIISKLTTQYGQGSINLETGEFTPAPSEVEAA